MKILSDVLVILFGVKCLINFIIENGSLADGLFLIAVVIYCFTMLDVKLPADE